MGLPDRSCSPYFYNFRKGGNLMKRIVLGILAHVDAGKTTLSEALLYRSGAIASLGRVDKGNSFFDSNEIERRRGITIFSKMATLSFPKTEITLLDTPGHIDFSTEMERALSVMDYALLLVSAKDGVTEYTVTLWKLLRARRIPTFIFVNKTDIAERRRADIFEELKRALGEGVVDFSKEITDRSAFLEECASASEELMEEYFDGGNLADSSISKAISGCKLFPALFGSALKDLGVDSLIMAVDNFTDEIPYSKNLFGAKVFKIGRDESGARLTYMKITGGSLAPKDMLTLNLQRGVASREKVESIRLYSGDKYKMLKSCEAGQIVAIPSLKNSFAGQGIGIEMRETSMLSPVLDYSINFESGTDVYEAYLKLAPLGEEDPSLSLRYDPKSREIRVRLMGDMQTQVLTQIIKERFGYSVSFRSGSILYKETISDTVYGAGHFEPLMHYAEVRLRLEPLPCGSGLVFLSEVPTDRLRTNWQRLIISHLEAKDHKGTLIGAPITDMKITLVAGRAHPKHTEGGDFREATYRALRQGLMKADPVLLEPTFDFEIRLPKEYLGKIMTDIENMHGSYDPPEFEEDTAILSGNAPVFSFRDYEKELRATSRGSAKISMMAGEYIPCHNSEEVIRNIGYDPELDEEAISSSVFCKGGAGYSVPWYEADEKMHTESPETKGDGEDNGEVPQRAKALKYRGTIEEDKELIRIFESTYGKIKPRKVSERVENSAAPEVTERRKKFKKPGEDYLLIDGYNLIYAWDELKKLADAELSHARDALISIVCNYQGFRKCNTIIVFDAYRRRGGLGSVEKCGAVTVVYTKEAQTADAYIEQATYRLAKENRVRVVTSDYVEQLIILGNGALRVPAREFISEVETTTAEIKDFLDNIR